MNLFVAGEIVKTRGLRGCLKVLSFLESPDIFNGLDCVYVEKSPEQTTCYHLRKVDLSGKFVFLELHGVTDVDAAQTIVGCKVLLPREALGELADDEYFWSDIVGLAVCDEQSGLLGRITTVFPTGSNDVYVCQGGPREILIPALADVIVKIDLEQGVMTVRLPEGL
ncbi:MAG: ribosome maturation factor RimM [Smithellaceae bacterium]